MPRKLMLSLSCLLFLAGAPVQAGDPMKEAIATLPADAMGFACVPSLKSLDANFQQAINDLNLQPFVQPPANSLVALIKQNLPMFAALDESGAFAIVLMPAETLMDLSNATALVVPAADPKAMLEGMGGQPGEGGVWSVSMMGQPSYAISGDKRIVVTQSAEVAKKFAESKGGLDAKLKPGEIKALEGLDLAIWLDGDRMLKLFKPQIDGLVAMATMMQAGSGPVGMKQAEATKNQVNMLVEGTSSLGLGVSLKKPGLSLRLAMTSKPGSELSKQMKVKPTAESLLKGLPGDKYMAVFGQTADPSQMKASMKAFDPYFGMLEAVEGIDKEKVGQLKSVVEEWLPMMSGLRGALRSTPDGSDGLFGASLLIDTSDAKKWLDLTGKAVELAKKLVTESTNEHIDADVKKAVEAITFKADAEDAGSVKTCHLKFDVAKVAEMDDEEKEELGKVLGKDGLLLRLAAVDGNTVAVTFGGGAAGMGKLVEAAKKKESPLDADAGIKKVATNLPAERASVLYLAVDQIIAGIQHVMKAVDEEELPVTMPTIDAPLAMSATGGDEWSRFDIFLPTELLVAAKNAGMAMMGGPPPAAGAPGAAAPPGGAAPSTAAGGNEKPKSDKPKEISPK
ncbi:MAG: hypothetical protein HY763_04305 [Planctomycetes bacterium]|nr:hypothetical protein [Planctomycetota bacterium]